MRRRFYALMIMAYTFMEGMKTPYLDFGEYSPKIATKKSKHLFSSSKTFYQNPSMKNNSMYYNKTFPRGNKLSYISLKGKEIKAKNKRKNIENRLK